MLHIPRPNQSDGAYFLLDMGQASKWLPCKASTLQALAQVCIRNSLDQDCYLGYCCSKTIPEACMPGTKSLLRLEFVTRICVCKPYYESLMAPSSQMQ